MSEKLNTAVAVMGIDIGKNPRRGATLAPGSALFPSRHRPETAPSWAGYRSVAIATCAFCSCRRPGLF